MKTAARKGKHGTSILSGTEMSYGLTRMSPERVSIGEEGKCHSMYNTINRYTTKLMGISILDGMQAMCSSSCLLKRQIIHRGRVSFIRTFKTNSSY